MNDLFALAKKYTVTKLKTGHEKLESWRYMVVTGQQ